MNIHIVILEICFLHNDAFSGFLEECNKDILIVLDTSYSIGKANFNDQVKPFLRDFVSDKTLNVGPDGAQVANAVKIHKSLNYC